MPAIQLNPKLHRAVHLLKSVKARDFESSFINNLSLSQEESAALNRLFNHPSKSGEEKRSNVFWL
ncbi:hypothetical protein [Paenibacillus sp. SYP-B4298]|uniref:hypothetical protein n=1 Tax=Paenibacillus sp. SYP-B4298 TaxID=2996034 RepID=UPI0022DDF12D|nr:hypothetical protein [Paenibacillus sp. SYP-B4298]